MSFKKRHKIGPCDITLEIHDDDFISPPHPSQKNWLITRSLEEIADDLNYLNDISNRFIEGSERQEIQQEWAKKSGEIR